MSRSDRGRGDGIVMLASENIVVLCACAFASKSRRSLVWYPQLACGMESFRRNVWNQSEGKIHAEGIDAIPSQSDGFHAPHFARRFHANPSDWIEKRPFENGLFS